MVAGDLSAETSYGPIRWTPLATGIDPRNVVQGLRVGPSGMRMAITFFDNSCLAACGLDRRNFESTKYRTDPHIRRGMLSLYSASRIQCDEFAEIAVELLTEFAPDPECADNRMPAWLRTARNILHDHFREPIGLGILAREVSVDATYLARTFRGRFGCSVSEYVRNLRLVEAASLLLTRGWSVGDAAVAAGFADHAHFARVYRQCIGNSPKSLKTL